MKHGEAGKGRTPLYNVWLNMRSRCLTETHPNYKFYGGIGITICETWDDFQVFKLWSVEAGYKPGLVLDKDELCNELGISPKKYGPGTCQWIAKTKNDSLPSGRYKLTVKDAEVIQAFLDEGSTFRAIENHFSCSYDAVQSAIKRLGLQVKRKHRPDIAMR